MDFDANATHRLEGSASSAQPASSSSSAAATASGGGGGGVNPNVGGLQMRPQFKLPEGRPQRQASALGLDRLAAQKREEQQAQKQRDEHERHLRARRLDTPSDAGGVNREA